MGRLASDILLGVAHHLRDVAWFDWREGRSQWMESKDMAPLALVNLVRLGGRVFNICLFFLFMVSL